MILEMHNTLENFFAFRMRVRDEVVGVKKIEGVESPVFVKGTPFPHTVLLFCAMLEER
jgi:hypothetical protein